MIIAVDGPTASGKGTLAQRLAAHYGMRRLDTGSLYRAVGLAVLDAGNRPEDARAAEAAALALDLDRIDETRIRTNAVSIAASKVAVHHGVREALLKAQRAFAAPGNAVIDGRDIGTVIWPEAEVKLFVTASLAARAKRRHADLVAAGERVSLADVERHVADRDHRDSTRAESPLRQAPDAHLLDTTDLSIEAAVEAACRIVDAARSRS